MGRAVAKEDSFDQLTSRTASYAKRVRWVNGSRPAITAAIRQAAAASAAADGL